MLNIFRGKKEIKNNDIYNPDDNSHDSKEFDLNIEKILENWENYHAIREIIANALDEQVITATNDIEIFQTKDGWWHIRDYGRGLNYHHLTQNENEEKINNDKLIGRFGVGLKDALATLYRHNVDVKIKSKFGVITLKTAFKVGFNDIVTLHAEIVQPEDSNMIGTDFCLYGCSVEDISMAKSLFLRFTDNKILESTKYGDVIEKRAMSSGVYINGVKVAEEPNFLFSYNITVLNAQIKKALNRERTNVGRTAYSGRIKDILKECSSYIVISNLVEDQKNFGNGNRHDELSWSDVAMHAYIKMSELNSDTTFVTVDDIESNPSIIDDMKRNGHDPVVVPSVLIDKMEDYNSRKDNEQVLVTTNQYIINEQSRFSPDVVDVSSLTSEELNVYNKTDQILELIGGKPKNVNSIQIVEKIYESEILYKTVGLWIGSENRILIKRECLCSISKYSGILLHECAHAISDAPDVSRDFENELTNIIGLISDIILSN